jgi:hypothetical protein
VLSTSMPSAPNRQACAKTISGQASASRRSPASAALVVEERAIAHILAIMLDEVEGIEARGIWGLTTAQLLEP